MIGRVGLHGHDAAPALPHVRSAGACEPAVAAGPPRVSGVPGAPPGGRADRPGVWLVRRATAATAAPQGRARAALGQRPHRGVVRVVAALAPRPEVVRLATPAPPLLIRAVGDDLVCAWRNDLELFP